MAIDVYARTKETFENHVYVSFDTKIYLKTPHSMHIFYFQKYYFQVNILRFVY
jgi:hypothetical protein